MKKIGLSLLATALLAACASQQPAPVTKPSAAAQQPAAAAAAAATTASSAPVAAAGGMYSQVTDPKSILSQREVFFDFDQYIVKEDSTYLVQSHSKFLTATKGARVSLQGHTDERGTAEYNLALGQKRADAVKTAMTSAFGVDASVVETTSYGKEQPAVQGSNDAAWAKNRRVEIVYPGEAKFPK